MAKKKLNKKQTKKVNGGTLDPEYPYNLATAKTTKETSKNIKTDTAIKR